MAWHAQFINKTLKTHGNADCVTKTNFPIVYTVRFVCKLCSHISRSADLSQTGHFQVIHMEPGVRQWPDQKQELPFVQNKTMDQHSSLWLRITMGQCPSRSRKKKKKPFLGPIWQPAKDSHQGIYLVPAAINSTKLSRQPWSADYVESTHGLHCMWETTRITL